MIRSGRTTSSKGTLWGQVHESKDVSAKLNYTTHNLILLAGGLKGVSQRGALYIFNEKLVLSITEYVSAHQWPSLSVGLVLLVIFLWIIKPLSATCFQDGCVIGLLWVDIVVVSFLVNLRIAASFFFVELSLPHVLGLMGPPLAKYQTPDSRWANHILLTKNLCFEQKNKESESVGIHFFHPWKGRGCFLFLLWNLSIQ